MHAWPAASSCSRSIVYLPLQGLSFAGHTNSLMPVSRGPSDQPPQVLSTAEAACTELQVRQIVSQAERQFGQQDRLPLWGLLASQAACQASAAARQPVGHVIEAGQEGQLPFAIAKRPLQLPNAAGSKLACTADFIRPYCHHGNCHRASQIKLHTSDRLLLNHIFHHSCIAKVARRCCHYHAELSAHCCNAAAVQTPGVRSSCWHQGGWRARSAEASLPLSTGSNL